MTPKTVKEFQMDTPAAALSLGVWLHETTNADWATFADLKASFPQADLIKGCDRVVFDIKGNHYRLITVVDFQRHGVLIRWFGTHAEYSKLTLQEMQTI
jgi:mRNA interferase HigB